MKNQNKKIGVGLYGVMILSCTLIFAVITFIIEPLSVFAVSDITVSVTLIPSIIDIARELAETLAFAVCYSIVIYAAVTKTQKKSWCLFCVYIAACAIRRLLVIGITYLTYSYIDSTDILSVCLYFVFDALMMLMVLLFSLVIGKRYNERRIKIEKAARITGDLSNIENIEFKSVYSKRNPLQICALFGGIILSITKLVMRIDYDIKYTKFYGAPSGIEEIFIMIVYYLSDILICAIFYALAWLTLSKLLRKDTSN